MTASVTKSPNQGGMHEFHLCEICQQCANNVVHNPLRFTREEILP